MWLDPLEKKTADTLIRQYEKHSIAEQKWFFLCMVSGGMDSMVLFHIIKKALRSKANPYRHRMDWGVVHFDHNTRQGDYKEYYHFVKNECIKTGVPFWCYEKKDFPEYFIENNFQNSARNWRKNITHQLARTLKEKHNIAPFIATGHHARDQVETILQHLIRGSGLEGLNGMKEWEQSAGYFRPLIKEPYKKVEEYARRNQVSFREDKSNLSPQYTRNKIRLHIIPEIEKINPKYEQSIAKFTEIIENLNREEQASVTTGSPWSWNMAEQGIPSREELIKAIKQTSNTLSLQITRNWIQNIRDHLLKWYSVQNVSAYSSSILLGKEWQLKLENGILTFCRI